MNPRFDHVVYALALGALTTVALDAQSSVVVLTLPASARAAGGGDAAPFVSDAAALFYGAQHLPNDRSASLSAGTWIGDVQLATLAYSTPWRRRVIAVGVQSLDYGSVDEVIPDPLADGTRGTATGGRVSGSELAASVGLAQTMGRSRTGVAVTYVHQQVADLSASAVTMSASHGITMGAWDLDLSAEHGGAPAGNPAQRHLTVPFTTRLSVATPSWSLAGSRWRGIAEYRRANREGSTSVIGAAGAFATGAGWMLEVRGAGVSYSDATARARWSAGGSAARGAWSLDYAYQGFGALGAVHRMGVSWRSRGPRSPSR